MATTTTNFGWDIPQSTDLVKDGATAIAALGQDIDTALVDLKGGTTGQVLAKASNTDLDYSWVTQDDANAIQNAIIDAKGDLISATAADTPARLAVGTNGQVLTVDSTTATGLKWSGAASSGMTLLSTTTLSGSSTTISSISGDYVDLYAIIYGVTYTGSADAIVVRPNGASTGTDSFNSYSYGTTTANTATVDGPIFVTYLSGTVSDANNSSVLSISKYASTGFKPYQSYGQLLHVGGSRGTSGNFGGYRSNSAITSLEFRVNTAGTSFTAGTVLLYGVK